MCGMSTPYHTTPHPKWSFSQPSLILLFPKIYLEVYYSTLIVSYLRLRHQNAGPYGSCSFLATVHVYHVHLQPLFNSRTLSFYRSSDPSFLQYHLSYKTVESFFYNLHHAISTSSHPELLRAPCRYPRACPRRAHRPRRGSNRSV